MKQQYKIFFAILALLLSSCTPPIEQKVSVISAPKIISPASVVVFAREAAITVYHYRYSNYQEHLSDVSKYFTMAGFNAYKSAFLASGNTQIIEDQKLTVSAIVTKAPVILRKGYVDLIYTWEVQVPLLVTYKNKTQTIQQLMIVNMTLVQVLENVSSRGIAINRFVVRPSKVIQIKSK